MPDHNEALRRADAVAHARRLVALFDHPLRDERHRALGQVIEMGDLAVPALVEALGSDARFTRTGALRALAQIGSADAVGPLMGYLRRHATEIGDNRAFAMQAIAAGTTPRHPDPGPLFELLQQSLRDRDDFVRAWAYVALGRLGDPRAAPLIEEGTRDRDHFVAEKAAEALADLAAAPPPPPSLTEQLLGPEQIGFALQAPEQGRRAMGLRALLDRVADAPDFNPFPLLLKLLRGPTRTGRRSAIEALTHLQRPEALNHLADVVARSDDADLVALALRGLVAHREALTGAASPIDRGALLDHLTRHLRSSDLLVRAAAVAALAALPGDAPVAHLVAACGDDESWIRDEASAALIEHDPTRLAPHVEPLARVTSRLAALLARRAAPGPDGPSAEARADATVIDRLLVILGAALPHHPPAAGVEAASDAGFATLAAPVARLRIAGLGLLHALTEIGHRPRPASAQQVRALASALTSQRGRVIDQALDVLEASLPRGSGAATAQLTGLLYKGDKRLALRVIELLGRAGDIEAREALRALSRNDDLDVSASALAVLHELEGAPL